MLVDDGQARDVAIRQQFDRPGHRRIGLDGDHLGRHQVPDDLGTTGVACWHDGLLG